MLDGLDGLDGISLNRLTTRSPYGDKKILDLAWPGLQLVECVLLWAYFFSKCHFRNTLMVSHISDVSDVGNVGDDGEKLFWLLWAISDHFSLLYDFVHFGQFCGHFCYDELMMN